MILSERTASGVTTVAHKMKQNDHTTLSNKVLKWYGFAFKDMALEEKFVHSYFNDQSRFEGLLRLLLLYILVYTVATIFFEINKQHPELDSKMLLLFRAPLVCIGVVYRILLVYDTLVP